jgi:hypothetical protein
MCEELILDMAASPPSTKANKQYNKEGLNM